MKVKCKILTSMYRKRTDKGTYTYRKGDVVLMGVKEYEKQKDCMEILDPNSAVAVSGGTFKAVRRHVEPYKPPYEPYRHPERVVQQPYVQVVETPEPPMEPATLTTGEYTTTLSTDTNVDDSPVDVPKMPPLTSNGVITDNFVDVTTQEDTNRLYMNPDDSAIYELIEGELNPVDDDDSANTTPDPE